MAPPRRVRDESLIVRRPGKPDVELFRSRETSYGEFFPTQRRFQVSPDARTLAFTKTQERELHVLRRDGASLVLTNDKNGELRFSPDSKVLAVVCWVDGKRLVQRIDLRRLEVSTWSDIENVIWMEYCAEGLVVLHRDAKDSSDRALTLLPWSGEPRTFYKTSFLLSRFVVAKQGTRVVAFVGNDVVSIDSIDALGADPVVVGRTRILVENAEMSPDGKTVVCATGFEAYRIDDQGPLTELPDRDLHTIWFSRDGSSFVRANAAGITWTAGEEVRTLSAGENETIRATRFLPSSPGVLVTRSREVVRWSPERDETDVLASAEENQEMLGADIWSGGLVLWMGTPWVRQGSMSTKG